MHQSVFELIHTEDQQEFRRNLHWALNPPSSLVPPTDSSTGLSNEDKPVEIMLCVCDVLTQVKGLNYAKLKTTFIKAITLTWRIGKYIGLGQLTTFIAVLIIQHFCLWWCSLFWWIKISHTIDTYYTVSTCFSIKASWQDFFCPCKSNWGHIEKRERVTFK